MKTRHPSQQTPSWNLISLLHTTDDRNSLMLPLRQVTVCLECKTSKPAGAGGLAGSDSTSTCVPHPPSASHFLHDLPAPSLPGPPEAPKFSYPFLVQKRKEIQKISQRKLTITIHLPTHGLPFLASDFVQFLLEPIPPRPWNVLCVHWDWREEAKAGGIIHKDKNVL